MWWDDEFSYDLGEKFYKVKYEDGDSEEIEEEQVTEHLHPSERKTNGMLKKTP